MGSVRPAAVLFAIATAIPAFGQRIIYVDSGADPTKIAAAEHVGSVRDGNGGHKSTAFQHVGRGSPDKQFGQSAAARARSARLDTNPFPIPDGTSWFTAFYDLHDALAIAQSGDEIWIAAGRYTPDRGTGDRKLSFRVPSGVQLYGGFGGWEWLREQRDWTVRETILSGDLNGDDGPADCAAFSDCCVGHERPGCDDDACEQIVCSISPECCEVSRFRPYLPSWDLGCALKARQECCDLGPGSSCENSIAIVDATGTNSSTVFDGLVVSGTFWSSRREEEFEPLGGIFAPNSGATIRNCVLTMLSPRS